MKNQKPILDTPVNFVLFTVLFALVVILLSIVVFNIGPNTNSMFGVALSLLCALPLGYGLFFNSRFIEKTKPYQRIILPALIFPLCILLSLGWNLYQQRPEGLFEMFVMEPIPNGVSNIQGHDISGGFDMEILLAFNATPEAIDKIIAKNELKFYNEDKVSYFIPNPDTSYLPDINWNENWTVYEKSSREKVESMTIWVNPQKDTVLFQFISG